MEGREADWEVVVEFGEEISMGRSKCAAGDRMAVYTSEVKTHFP